MLTLSPSSSLAVGFLRLSSLTKESTQDPEHCLFMTKERTQRPEQCVFIRVEVASGWLMEKAEVFPEPHGLLVPDSHLECV